MEIQTEVKADNTTDKDRELMSHLLKKGHYRRLSIYFPLTLLCIGGIAFVNLFDVRFDLNETVRGVWNAVFVIGGALPLRLAIGEIINYSKDVNNFQVKTAKGKILELNGKVLTIGNYSFNLSALPEQELKTGDTVELRAGYRTSSVFWLKKLN